MEVILGIFLHTGTLHPSLPIVDCDGEGHLQVRGGAEVRGQGWRAIAGVVSWALSCPLSRP